MTSIVWENILSENKNDVKRRNTLDCLDQYRAPDRKYTRGEYS